jgi:2-polyprenyl-3-methyl-5-hydroxy-6-metoxy-1,4-benzoquinol methylase
MNREDQDLYALRPWYHDFATFGIDTVFGDLSPWQMRLSVLKRVISRLPGLRSRTTTSPIQEVTGPRIALSHRANQAVKERHILGHLRLALEKLGPIPTCLDLFCSDGYYSCHIQRLSSQAVITGIDLDAKHIARARAIAHRLGYDQIQFHHEDAWSFLETGRTQYDLILCTGGLYHLADPQTFLEKLRHVAKGFLIVQSVVTIHTEDSKFFQQPARGWQHGCRFTHAWLHQALIETGWEILEESRALLPGNRRLSDKGTSFFSCRI